MALLKAEIFSRSLMRTVPITVILPVDNVRDVSEELSPLGKKYKTLYLLNGMYGSDCDWIGASDVAMSAAERNLAVVMPAGENHFYVDCSSTGEKYGEFIGKELIDLTRRMFPLSWEREDTYIAGLSMGGYGAVRNGLKYGDTFGCLGGFSCAFILDRMMSSDNSPLDFTQSKKYYEAIFGDISKFKGSDNDCEALYLKRKTSGAPMPKMYLACGTEDFLLNENREFRDFLEKESAEFTYEEWSGEHNYDFWSVALKRMLNWLPLEDKKEGISSNNVGRR